MRISDWSSDVCSSDLIVVEHVDPSEMFGGLRHHRRNGVRLARIEGDCDGGIANLVSHAFCCLLAQVRHRDFRAFLYEAAGGCRTDPPTAAGDDCYLAR